MITKTKIDKATNAGRPVSTPKVNVSSAKDLPPEIRTQQAPSESAMMFKIKVLLNDIGTVDEAIESMISPGGHEALKMIKSLVKTIFGRCVRFTVDEETGEVKDEVDYGKLFTSFQVEEIQGMQAVIAASLGILSSTYSRAIAQSGLEYRSTKIAQEYVYSDARSLLTGKIHERVTEKMIEGYIANNMIETYISQVRYANLAEYLEVVFETSEMIRNVLQSLYNSIVKDRINEYSMIKNQT
jgi:hypothetical protein